MGEQLDLIEAISRYPVTAGYKDSGAGMMAAAAVTKSSKRQWAKDSILKLFDTKPDWTPDEAAASLNINILYSRPRFSELEATGSLIKTEWTRPSSNGGAQHVYLRVAHE